MSNKSQDLVGKRSFVQTVLPPFSKVSQGLGLVVTMATVQVMIVYTDNGSEESYVPHER